MLSAPGCRPCRGTGRARVEVQVTTPKQRRCTRTTSPAAGGYRTLGLKIELRLRRGRVKRAPHEGCGFESAGKHAAVLPTSRTPRPARPEHRRARCRDARRDDTASNDNFASQTSHATARHESWQPPKSGAGMAAKRRHRKVSRLSSERKLTDGEERVGRVGVKLQWSRARPAR
jgi:hypothetical protein